MRALVEDVLDDALGVEECEDGALVPSVARRAHLHAEDPATICRDHGPDDELAVGIHLLPARFGQDFAQDLFAVLGARELRAAVRAQDRQNRRVLREHGVHAVAPRLGVAGEFGGHPDLGAASEHSVEPSELRFEHVAERARVRLGLSLDLDFPVTAEAPPDEHAQAGAEHQDHQDRDGSQPFGAAVFVGHHR